MKDNEIINTVFKESSGYEFMGPAATKYARFLALIGLEDNMLDQPSLTRQDIVEQVCAEALTELEKFGYEIEDRINEALISKFPESKHKYPSKERLKEMKKETDKHLAKHGFGPDYIPGS